MTDSPAKELPPALDNGSSRYGAQMGRPGEPMDSTFSGLVYVEPIGDPCPNACGAYDYAGAYWGVGTPVYRLAWFDGDSWRFHFARISGIASYDYPNSYDLRRAVLALEDGFDESATFQLIERQGADLCGADSDCGEPCEYCYECEASELLETLTSGAYGEARFIKFPGGEVRVMYGERVGPFLSSEDISDFRDQSDSEIESRVLAMVETLESNQTPEAAPAAKWALYFHRELTDSEIEAGGYDGVDSGVWQSVTVSNLRAAIEAINSDGPASGYDYATGVDASGWPVPAGAWFTVYYQSSRTVSVHRRDASSARPTASSARRTLAALRHHCG